MRVKADVEVLKDGLVDLAATLNTMGRPSAMPGVSPLSSDIAFSHEENVKLKRQLNKTKKSDVFFIIIIVYEVVCTVGLR